MIASPKKNEAPIIPKHQRETALLPEEAFDQHDERENAAFAPVVGAHDNEDIFDGDDCMTAQTSSDTTPKTAVRRSPPASTIGCRARRMA